MSSFLRELTGFVMPTAETGRELVRTSATNSALGKPVISVVEGPVSL
jgi:hypothetical protein